MPEDFRDLRHRGTLADHFGRQTMTKLMGSTAARAADFSSGEGLPHDVANCRRAC